MARGRDPGVADRRQGPPGTNRDPCVQRSVRGDADHRRPTPARSSAMCPYGSFDSAPNNPRSIILSPPLCSPSACGSASS